MCAQLGGKVEAGHHREFGRAFLDIQEECALFEGVWAKGYAPSGLDEPWRPRDGDTRWLRVVGTSTGAPFAAIANEAQKILRRAVPPGSGAHAGWRQAS